MKARPSDEQIRQALIDNGGNASAAARQLGIAGRTMRRWVAEGGITVETSEQSAPSSDKRKVAAQKATPGSLPERPYTSPSRS